MRIVQCSQSYDGIYFARYTGSVRARGIERAEAASLVGGSSKSTSELRNCEILMLQESQLRSIHRESGTMTTAPNSRYPSPPESDGNDASFLGLLLYASRRRVPL